MSLYCLFQFGIISLKLSEELKIYYQHQEGGQTYIKFSLVLRKQLQLVFKETLQPLKKLKCSSKKGKACLPTVIPRVLFIANVFVRNLISDL